jgi:hypothetical protein
MSRTPRESAIGRLAAADMCKGESRTNALLYALVYAAFGLTDAVNSIALDAGNSGAYSAVDRT